MKAPATIQFSLVSQKTQTPLEASQSEHIILASYTIAGDTTDEDFDEFVSLVDATGATVVDRLRGNCSTVVAKTFIGKGKLDTIAESVTAHCVQLVVFNHHLSASQERNIERHIGCRVLDRTGLILDIFSRRAQTFEGKLQVELAQLNYITTKLVRGWTHLERQKGGLGLRGPGETQLETDRRLIRGRIKMLKKRLSKVVTQRQQGRTSRKRSQCLSVALVGYTNAGKSTLFNALTHSDILVADQLFATLDPTVRQLALPGVEQCVLSDTVGFIRRLPHDLVAAFSATLTEVCEADLLLHVVDASHPEKDILIDAVNDVLKQIGAENVPQLMVYNKIDQLKNRQPRVDYDEQGLPLRLWMSVTESKGLPLLQETIGMCLNGPIIDAELMIPLHCGKLLAQLHAMQVVTGSALHESGNWSVIVRMPVDAYQSVCKKLDNTDTV